MSGKLFSNGVVGKSGADFSTPWKPCGKLTDREDAKSQRTEYGYDSLNRLTSITNEGIWKASFDYDPNGNRTEVRNQQSEVSFGYDEMNRLTNSEFQVSGFEFQVSSAYDLNGNRTNILYPGGLSVSYSYDEENRLTGTTLTGSPIFNAFNVLLLLRRREPHDEHRLSEWREFDIWL